MRFIAFILAAALCLAPASAADVYRVQSDTNVLSMSAYDVVATAEWSDNQISQVLTYLSNIYSSLSKIYSDTSSIVLDVGSMEHDLGFLLDRFGYSNGGTLAADLASLINSFGFKNWGVSFRELLTGNMTWSYSLMDFLNMDYLSDQRMETAFDSFQGSFTALSDVLTTLSSYYRVPTGVTMLGGDGFYSRVTSPSDIFWLIRTAFLGIASHLIVGSESTVLGPSGSSLVLTSDASLDTLLRYGFLGLSSNVRAISSGGFSLLPFFSDSGESAEFHSDDMGHMLSLLLSRMQIDLGHLGFLYADDDAIQAKKDAAENEKAATDGFLKPGGPGSLSVSDITSAAGAVGSTKDMLSTGVSPGQAFEQLQGSGPLEFFTSVTAANLNTVPVSVAEEDDDFVHFYDPSNSEFFELIGKGGG